MYETEDNKTVAAALCVGLAETINKVGPAFMEGRKCSMMSFTQVNPNSP